PKAPDRSRGGHAGGRDGGRRPAPPGAHRARPATRADERTPRRARTVSALCIARRGRAGDPGLWRGPPVPNTGASTGVEERGELGGIPDREIAVAIIHQGMNLSRLSRQLLDLWDPLLQLILIVKVPEPLQHAHIGLVPRFGPPPVKPDHSKIAC